MNLENELLENQLLENQLLENFQVEELEKRYEMGWAPDSGSGTATYNEANGWGGSVTASWTFG